MNDTPNWIIDFLNRGNVSCGLCNKKFSEDDLISVGVQESIMDANKEMLTIGMYCDSCQEVTLAEIKEMSLVELSSEVLENDEDIEDEEYEIYRRKNMAKNDQNFGDKDNDLKTNISKKDVSNVVKFLNSINTHDELLTAMGMSPEEVEKFKIEGEKERKRNKYGK